MITVLYPISYVLTIGSLLAWFYFQSSKPWYIRLSRIFLAAFALYLFSVGTAEAAMDYKAGTLFRDLTIMGAIGFTFQALLRKKKAFILAAIFLVGGMNWYFQTKLMTTFPQQKVSGVEEQKEDLLDALSERFNESVGNEGNTELFKLGNYGELLVEIKENSSYLDIINVISDYNLRYRTAFTPESELETDLDDYLIIDIPENFEGQIESIKSALYATGHVDWIEFNETLSVAPIESSRTPTTKERFGIDDPGVEHLWGFEAMQMDQLYAYLKENNVKPKKTALIAILDTGVDSKHEDIAANYKSIKSKHDDDPKGHGTHCAGIAAAVSNNGKGVASFSQTNEYVQVTSIKVLNSYGMGTQKSIIDGIILAADSGADVISMSLGGRSSQSKQTAYKKAVQYANKKGAIVIAAAGNSNRNAKDFAPVNAPGVIGVSALDEELNKAVFSNTVEDITMGIAAPGVNIYSTIPDSKYATYNGTSMATPYVSGLVGLMKSVKPGINTKQVHQILSSTGKDSKSTKRTGKFIQPAKAIKKLLE